MVSGGVLVICQGDMLVGLPGGPSPFLRMNFLVGSTPMQWVMWAAVKINCLRVVQKQLLTLISYYENWCENGLPQFWSLISFFQFTYHNGRFRGSPPFSDRPKYHIKLVRNISPIFIAGFITSIWKTKVYPLNINHYYMHSILQLVGIHTSWNPQIIFVSNSYCHHLCHLLYHF